MLKPDRIKRKKRIRSKISGTTERPRVSVFRSNKYIYAQAIDDSKGITIAQAKSDNATQAGNDLAKKLIDAKVKAVVFDRGGYRYHGRVEALANGLREGGVQL